MAEIRAIVTVAVTANFAGIGAPTACAPLLYEQTTGDLYALLSPDTVVLVGSVAGGSSHLLAGQAFGKHLVGEVRDEVGEHLASKAFDRPVSPPPADEVSARLAAQAFDHPPYPAQAVLGDASDILQAKIFAHRLFPSMWM